MLAIVERREQPQRVIVEDAPGTSRRSAWRRGARSGFAPATSFSDDQAGHRQIRRSRARSRARARAGGPIRPCGTAPTDLDAVDRRRHRHGLGQVGLDVARAIRPDLDRDLVGDRAAPLPDARRRSTAAPALSAARKVRIAITAMSARPATELTGTSGGSRRRDADGGPALLLLGLMVAPPSKRRHGDGRRQGPGAARRKAPSASGHALRSPPQCRVSATP